ncbi:nucleotidyltransferase family protein [Gracilibacillus sp. YIM 98692]|uniref:nucleotidyltransferase family protein n=1 Tax=Gracilibacillus sp. YIM 98692 TaxID=2663532 RepID=UPI0013D34021|nr:nucleotidyltransferase family protein [Gracilibacillus sp. YIM 98692]
MKGIILAAGYATRLYPLTKNTAKPLLEVAGKTILDHIVEKLEKVEAIDEIYIVTNEKFYQSFVDWAAAYNGPKQFTVINDHTTSNETRLGAIADIDYVLQTTGLADDVMVLAGDNLFDLELDDFSDFFQQKQADCITVHVLEDEAELKRTGVVEVDENDTVISFEEKPEMPKSQLAVPPFYLYRKETLPLFRKYIEEGHNPDAPGHFVPWLIEHKKVYAYRFEGRRYDIGTLESYQKVQELF